MRTLLALLLVACHACGHASDAASDKVVARVGDVSFTIAQLKQRYADAPPEARERYSRDALALVHETLALEEVLISHARRFALAPPNADGTPASREQLIDAMGEKIAGDIRSTVQAAEIPDDAFVEIARGDPRLAHLPPRVSVVAMIFARQEDAERAASDVRRSRAKPEDIDAFRSLYASAMDRIRPTLGKNVSEATRGELWEFKIAPDSGSKWPKDLLDELLAAPLWSVVGPKTATVPPYDTPRYYVFKVEQQLPEQNTVAQLRTRLAMTAIDREVARRVQARGVEMAVEATDIVEPTLLRSLNLSTP